MNERGAARTDTALRLSDRLAAARRARFVGRAAEVELFAQALAAREPPFAVLHVVGPGGIGKTTLLQAYADMARQAGRPVVCLDARGLVAEPGHFVAALAQAMGVDGIDAATLAAHCPRDAVLVVDTIDGLAALEGWWRDVLLPQLPAQVIVVLAGRHAPGPEWTTEVQWAPLTRIVALRNLSPDDSQSYLALRGVAPERHAQLLALTHGHPLALSLLADACARQDPDRALDLQHAPDIVRVLLHKLLDAVPSPQHRLALDACASVRATTEPLLAAALDGDDAHAMFEWLAGLSFMEQGPRGLFPHDVVREALCADARWRDPERRRALNARLLAHLYERFQRAEAIEQQRIWSDLIYVQRYNAGLRPFFVWSAVETAFAEPKRPGDDAAMVEMTARHEGEASARLARHWLHKQPAAFLAWRDLAGRLIGFMTHLRLDLVDDEDRRIDPAIEPALRHMRTHGPMRAGEQAIHLRFWMADEDYQSNRATMNVLAAKSSACWTSQAALAWNFAAMADPAHFEPMFASIHIWRTPQADFEVGGRHYGVFAHDWRVETVAQWMMAKVDRASQVDARVAVESAAPLLVLSEADFSEAVRQALRDYVRGDALARNPLLRTRLLHEHGAGGAGSDALRALLREAAQALERGTPMERKLHLAIWHTYLQPAASQERAAELLDLPFNTYRYQLARGTQRITEWLWRRELGGT